MAATVATVEVAAKLVVPKAGKVDDNEVVNVSGALLAPRLKLGKLVAAAVVVTAAVLVALGASEKPRPEGADTVAVAGTVVVD